MKKVFLSLLIVLAGLETVLAGEEVKSDVLNAFKKSFPCAREVSWQVSNNHYQAAFLYHGAWMFAHYNATTGQWLGLTRNIISLQLPLYLQKTVRDKYASYWITNVVEESNEKGFNYYIRLQNAHTRITLVSKHGNDWTVLNKQQKS